MQAGSGEDRSIMGMSSPARSPFPESRPLMHYIAPTGTGGGARAFTPEEKRILDLVNLKVAGEASLAELLEFLFAPSRELCPCDRIGLAFLADEGRRIVAQDSVALYQPLLLRGGYAEDLASSSLRRVIDGSCSRIIYDLPRYLEQNPRSRSSQLLVREGVRSSLTCPLTVNERKFGVIFLSSREARAYTPYHMQLWMAIAERLAQAVEKVWRIEQLQAANQAYTEVLAFVSHELKNPIASMITDARMLADGYLGPVTAQQRQKLGRLMGKGGYLLELIREYLDLARMEGGHLALRPRLAGFLEEVVAPAVELILPQFQDRGMILERSCPEGLEVQCDPDLLRIVLVNLLGNAVKYGRTGGVVRVGVERQADQVAVTVWNQGPGFDAEERPRLFRKFSRLQAPELRARKGTGLGLYTAWRIVHLHGGRMDARSEPGQWAEFSLELPQPLVGE
jgi:signal transduction histidine kinase